MTEILAKDLKVLPANQEQIEQARASCRQLVRQRAMMAAGVSAVPIPGFDLVSDLALFAKMVDEVNQAFGLTAEQVERMQPKYQLVASQAALAVGGVMVGKLITRELAKIVLRRAGARMMGKSALRMVPIAGQIAAAAIGFAAFRQLGNQHVDACTAVARELMVARDI